MTPECRCAAYKLCCPMKMECAACRRQTDGQEYNCAAQGLNSEYPAWYRFDRAQACSKDAVRSAEDNSVPAQTSPAQIALAQTVLAQTVPVQAHGAPEAVTTVAAAEEVRSFLDFVQEKQKESGATRKSLAKFWSGALCSAWFSPVYAI
jgi:hypothetical protein